MKYINSQILCRAYCMASWRTANKSEKEKQGITLGETFEEAGRAKESFKDIINDDVQ